MLVMNGGARRAIHWYMRWWAIECGGLSRQRWKGDIGTFHMLVTFIV